MAQEASHHEASSLSAYLRVLRRRKWIVLVCALLVPCRRAVLLAPAADAVPVVGRRATLPPEPRQQRSRARTTSRSSTTRSLTATQASLAHTPDVARAALAIAKIERPDARRAAAELDRGVEGNHRHPRVPRHRPRPRAGGAARDVLRAGLRHLSRGSSTRGRSPRRARMSTATLDAATQAGARELRALHVAGGEGAAARRRC